MEQTHKKKLSLENIESAIVLIGLTKLFGLGMFPYNVNVTFSTNVLFELNNFHLHIRVVDITNYFDSKRFVFFDTKYEDFCKIFIYN